MEINEFLKFPEEDKIISVETIHNCAKTTYTLGHHECHLFCNQTGHPAKKQKPIRCSIPYPSLIPFFELPHYYQKNRKKLKMNRTAATCNQHPVFGS